jgi:uncharacterized RDD family membrane protein YckC
MAAPTSEFDFNHWVLRLIALVIDAIIIGIIAWVIYYVALAPIIWPRTTFFGVTVSAEPWWSGYFVYPFIQGIIWVLYSAVLDVSWGATIGKRVMGFQVQMVNGGKVDFGKAFMREISKIYPLLLLLDWIIGVATPGPDRKQRYFDRMAGTTVVSIKQPFQAGVPPPPPPPPPT